MRQATRAVALIAAILAGCGGTGGDSTTPTAAASKAVVADAPAPAVAPVNALFPDQTGRYPAGQGLLNALRASYLSDFARSPLTQHAPVTRLLDTPSLDRTEVAIDNTASNAYRLSIDAGPGAGTNLYLLGSQIAVNSQHSPVTVTAFRGWRDDVDYGCDNASFTYAPSGLQNQPFDTPQWMAIGEWTEVGRCTGFTNPNPQGSVRSIIWTLSVETSQYADRYLVCLNYSWTNPPPGTVAELVRYYCPRFYKADNRIDLAKLPWVAEPAAPEPRYPAGQGILDAMVATWTPDFSLSALWPMPYFQSVALPRPSLDTVEIAIGTSAWNAYQRSIYNGPLVGAFFVPIGFQFALDTRRSPISMVGYQFFGDGYYFGCTTAAPFTPNPPPGQPDLAPQVLAIGESTTIGKCVGGGAPDLGNKTWYFTFTLSAWQSKLPDRYLACLHASDDRLSADPLLPTAANGLYCPRFFKETGALDTGKLPWRAE